MKIRMRLISVSIIFFLAGLLIEVYGNIIYVDALANAAKNGSSWINAYSSLKLAIESVTIGDKVCIKDGIYVPDLNDNSVSHTTDRSMYVFRGFSGAELFGETGFWSNRDPILYETILSGDINGDDIGITNNSDNCLHIVTNSTSGVLLDGWSFLCGNATSNSGGAVYLSAVPTRECIPTFISCAFLNNNSQYTGRAVYVVGGCEGGSGTALPVFNNTTFFLNISTWSTGTAGGAKQLYFNE